MVLRVEVGFLDIVGVGFQDGGRGQVLVPELGLGFDAWIRFRDGVRVKFWNRTWGLFLVPGIEFGFMDRGQDRVGVGFWDWVQKPEPDLDLESLPQPLF